MPRTRHSVRSASEIKSGAVADFIPKPMADFTQNTQAQWAQ
jgi:hypothetical protein